MNTTSSGSFGADPDDGRQNPRGRISRVLLTLVAAVSVILTIGLAGEYLGPGSELWQNVSALFVSPF